MLEEFQLSFALLMTVAFLNIEQIKTALLVDLDTVNWADLLNLDTFGADWTIEDYHKPENEVILRAAQVAAILHSRRRIAEYFEARKVLVELQKAIKPAADYNAK